MKVSEVEDKNGILVKEGDKLSFKYDGLDIVTEVKYHNGLFIVVSPDNNPISCMLSQLDKHADSFLIVG